MAFIISCEHGGNNIPKKYLSSFKNKKKILNSHRGWDTGALILAKKVAQDLSASLCYSTTSRLLIDLNRSLHHPHLFSEFSKKLDNDSKQNIINKFYIPYRSEIKDRIKILKFTKYPVIHLSIHSFTNELDGLVRQADIGLLYDPARMKEKLFCKNLKSSLELTFPELIIRSNYPYLGYGDGFTTTLRQRFNEKEYLGIEIEINQKHVLNNTDAWRMIKKNLSRLILNNSVI